MSTPTARSTIDSHLDPLLAPLPPPPLSSSSSAPLSFKRRGTSNSGTSTPTGRPGMGAKAVSMLGGLLSGTSPSSSSAQRDPADPERDLIPQSRVPPSHQQQQQEHLPRTRRRDARLSHRPSESDFSQAVTARSETGSDDDDNDDDAEEEEDEEEDRTHSTISALGIGRGWRKRGPERSSFGASGGAGGGGKNARRASSVQFLSPRRPSRGGVGLGRHGGTNGGGGGGGAGDEAEYASAAGGGGGEQAAVAVTPLPVIPILVLSIAMFGEFLSASVSSPFLFFMVESFGVGTGPNGGGESSVSLWTGIVASSFFLAQLVTALLWVNVAEKRGRRVVLCASLLGSAVTTFAFGTSKNLGTAITTRLAMGLFGGAVGVARSAINDVTDETNRSAAYTIVSLVWSMGGICGSILGGLLEHPAEKFPSYFGDSELFIRNPYLLPCMCAASVTGFGGVLSLFLNRDGGQRTGGIHLPTEKDVEVATGTLSRIKDYLLALLSSLIARFSRRQPISLPTNSSSAVSLHPSHAAIPPLPSPAPSPSLLAADTRDPLTSGSRRASNAASHSRYGSAYGYSRHPSVSAFTGVNGEGGLRIPSMRRRGPRTFSMATSNRYGTEGEVPHSFAERLLLANNQAVFSLSDVFLAKAAADDQFSAIEYEESAIEHERDGDGDGENDDEDIMNDAESRIDGTDADANSEYGDVGFGTAPPSMDDLRAEAYRQDEQRRASLAPTSPSLSSALAPNRQFITSPNRDRLASFGGSAIGPPPSSLARFNRRPSASSIRPFSIYSNTGLAAETIASSSGNQLTSTAVAAQTGQGQGQGQGQGRPDESNFAPMQAIPEQRAPSVIDYAEEEAGIPAVAKEGEQSAIWQLPLGIISLYFLLGLHGGACDQVFGTFVVTKVSSGGLGLSAQHFSILVACMFFFQLIWNFRFYPAVGPPNGPLSHLAMFRLGLFLYIPVYLLFPELRGLILVEGEDALVMTGMVVLSSIRYLANCLSFTAVTVLINVLTPPPLVPLANGLAQSLISLARFIGPLLGGSIFSASIAGPTPQPATGFLFIAGLCSLAFLLSWRIR